LKKETDAEENKINDLEDLPTIPAKYSYTEEARQKRLSFIQEQTGTKMEQVSNTALDPHKLSGNIESYIGTIEVPVGVAGPLRINGQHAKGLFYAPMATTEGALVASVTRGAKALSLSGGVTSRVLGQRMVRAPLFLMNSIESVIFFSSWLLDHLEEIRKETRKYSKHAHLKELEPIIIGRAVHVQFVYETGDAAGQNMTTIVTWQVCLWILEQMKIFKNVIIDNFIIEGGLSSDKKVSSHSFIRGRGIQVIASAFIPESVLISTLNVNLKQLSTASKFLASGSIRSGLIGSNVNVANVIAGIFTATGQDIACVHESALGQLTFEPEKDGIYVSMMLPTLIIGTIGGGTGLPCQNECLKLMGCNGQGNAYKLAEIIASYCLALDLSTASAIMSGQFADAHERLGRNKPKAAAKEVKIEKNK
jgi:NADP-dependent 3-hydroxy-3-methylglutaryl-CoA reductase